MCTDLKKKTIINLVDGNRFELYSLISRMSEESWIPHQGLGLVCIGCSSPGGKLNESAFNQDLWFKQAFEG